MKRKRKKEVCHALKIATDVIAQVEKSHGLKLLQDLKALEKTCVKGLTSKNKASINDAYSYTRAVYTIADWLDYKQIYKVSTELAKDLFSMEDLSFPMNSLHLPFPNLFIDTEELDMEADGMKMHGMFFMLKEVPYGDSPVEICSMVCVAAGKDDDDYHLMNIAFDADPEHGGQDIKGVIHVLTASYSKALKKAFCNALLFAAYLSSTEPDVVENPQQKVFYRPSSKPKLSSVRKWDVGFRYMVEKRSAERRHEAGGGHGTHASPRPHIRKAHWHTYWVGTGRQEKKVRWIAPITVGVRQEMPVVIRRKGE